jgi:uncharacterized protein (TIGR02217 family)
MAFHQVRFPLDVSLDARGGPERATDIVTLSSGREERNSRWLHSRRRYNAAYGIKSRADMQAVLGFFEERRGRFHSFLWRDALDHSSDGLQPLGIGDGVETQFQLVKRYGASFDPYDRPITKPVAGSVHLFADGVDEPGFDLDELSGIVTFHEAPEGGAVLTAQFEFDVAVRFDIDRLDVQLSNFDAAEIPSIPVVEVRE